MNALPALPAAPVRAAAPTEPAADDAAGEGGFAAALEQARDPKAMPADSIARCGSQTADKSAQKGTRGTDAKARAVCDDSGEDTTTPADEAADAAGCGTPDLAALLPGWPPAPATPATTTFAAGAAVAHAVRASPGQTAVDAVGEAEARRPQAAKAGERQPADMPDGATAPQALRLAAAPAAARPVLDRPAALDTRVMAGKEPMPTVQVIKSLAEAGITNTAAIATPMPPHMAPASNNGLPPPAAPTFEARLAAAIDTPAFAPALANQVTWLAHEGVQHARLSLNPAEMGPLAVQIVLDGTQARVDFSADLAATRAAIEASLPALAAALHDSGLTLAGGGVSDGQARQGAPEGRPMPATGEPTNDSQRGSGSAGLPTAPQRSARGLVDLVA